jgi:hypothetical protein
MEMKKYMRLRAVTEKHMMPTTFQVVIDQVTFRTRHSNGQQES